MKRPAAGTAASLAIATALLALMVITFDVDIAAAWTNIRNADHLLLAAAAAVHYTTFLFRAIRWKCMLDRAGAVAHGQKPIGSLFCAQAVLLSWFVNSVVWIRIGDAYRAYLCHRHHHASIAAVAGTLVAERALDTALITAALLAVIPLIAQAAGTPAWPLLTTAGSAAGILILLTATLLTIGKPLLTKLPPKIALTGTNFLRGANTIRQRPLETTAAGILAWAAEASRLHLTAIALDIHLSAPVTIFLAIASSLLTLAPTPGGVGAVEPAVTTLAVRLASTPRDPAAALVLADRAISHLSIIATGGLLLAIRAIPRPGNITPDRPPQTNEV